MLTLSAEISEISCIQIESSDVGALKNYIRTGTGASVAITGPAIAEKLARALAEARMHAHL
ncbi:hypothetical protein [Caenispirillum bisanense]|uniref:Uncharacterized protein n=1 Tax=Caenispirillum bisanense TaxID=414052 RepID=A0A286GNS9_9PROT|nr:hypothetical protein [Caenispirillum bisanense]SOD97211.1 hypothetical protein SAMN05421508_106333 [Caenispirillum bisanense]